MRDSILDVMSHGGGAMWLILVFSVLAVGVAVERVIAQFQFITRARGLADTVGRCLSRGALSEGRSACERSPSPLADVFLVGYERHGRVKPELVATAVHRDRMRVNGDLRVQITDDGSGLRVGPGRGHGLESMRRRAADVVGSLSIGPADPTGTVVTAVLPLRSAG